GGPARPISAADIIFTAQVILPAVQNADLTQILNVLVSTELQQVMVGLLFGVANVIGEVLNIPGSPGANRLFKITQISCVRRPQYAYLGVETACIKLKAAPIVFKAERSGDVILLHASIRQIVVRRVVVAALLGRSLQTPTPFRFRSDRAFHH